MTSKAYHKEKSASPTYEDLLQRVGARKDREAFVTLFDYYAPRVKSYLLKHGADETTAEEIVQSTFIAVWEKARSYDPKKSAASTWIFTIARNKRIDILRREKFIEVNTESPALENATTGAEEEAYAESAELEQLNTALDKLPQDQAALVRMSFFEDKSHSAIAKETRLPLGTVKSRLRLALDRLRQSLRHPKTEKTG